MDLMIAWIFDYHVSVALKCVLIWELLLYALINALSHYHGKLPSRERKVSKTKH